MMSDVTQILSQMESGDRSSSERLNAQEAALGRWHPETLMTVANLGVNYKDVGRLAEAIPLLEEAYMASKREPLIAWVGQPLLDAYVKAADPAKPQSIARVTTLVREMLGGALLNLKKYAEAESRQEIFYCQNARLRASRVYRLAWRFDVC